MSLHQLISDPTKLEKKTPDFPMVLLPCFEMSLPIQPCRINQVFLSLRQPVPKPILFPCHFLWLNCYSHLIDCLKISSGLNMDTVFFLKLCMIIVCRGAFHRLHDSLSRTWDLPSRLGWLMAEPQDAAPLVLSTKRYRSLQPASYRDIGDQPQVFRACKANTTATELSPGLWIYISIYHHI